MKIHTPASSLTACAMVAALLLVGCGGGSGEPPPAQQQSAADTKAPTVTITDDASATDATGPVTFRFSFDEDVGTSFTADDVTVVGGTAGAFTRIDGRSATLVVTPPSNSTGMIQVSIAAGKVSDAAGNTNASVSSQQAFNTVVPVVRTRLVSFEETPAPTLAGFGGAEDSTVVVDPTDPSNKVAKVVKSATAELFAGTTVSVCPANGIAKLPFSATLTSLSVRVWSPDAGIPVRLKVEDSADASKSVETEATTTTAGGWQTLTFNFANQVAGTASLNLANTYDKASIFFNFGKTGAQAGGAKTYYFDDLSFVGSTFGVACPGAGGGGGSGSTSTISFDEATAPKLAGFGGAEDSTIVADPTNAANKVARVVKSAAAELWAGTTVSTLANDAIPKIAFSASATTVTVRVWSPDAGIPVRLKVEDANDAAKSVETEAMTTVAGAWQTLTFNFANQAAGTAPLNLANTYDKVSIFFNFGKTGAQAGGAKTYYFDDLVFPGAAAQPSTTTVSFDEATAPKLTGFGGAEDATIVADPTNAANKVARVVKSAAAELWAGTTVSTLANSAIPKIVFSASATTVTVRVWSPDAGIPVRLKVEDASDPAKSVETEAMTTVAGGWQTLSFNFANQAAGTAPLNLANTYDKVSIFFNFGKTGAQAGGARTYFFDDLVFPAAAAAAQPSTTTVSFDEATAPKLTGFGGAEDATIVADPTNAANKVARVVKSAAAELWAGTTVSTLANSAIPKIVFSASATTVTVRVWSPDAGIPVRLKVEDASDPAKSVETEAMTTVAGGWQTLSFNFANQAAGTAPLNLANTYDKVSIFFNFGKTGAQAGGAKTYYFDDLAFPA